MLADLERVKIAKNYLFANKGPADEPSWVRVRASTDFTIVFDVETESYDYVLEESLADGIKSYRPTIGQSQMAFINDFIFDYIFGHAIEQSVGVSAITEGVIVFQQKEEDGDRWLAWKFYMTITIDTYDLVAGTLTYTIGTKGNILKGFATINEQGELVFEEII